MSGSSPGAERVLFLLVLVVAIVLGIIGAAVEGMLYLLSIGVVLLVAGVAYLAVRSALGSHRRPVR